MSLSVFNPLPDQTRQINDLKAENDNLKDRVNELEAELRKERRKSEAVERGAAELRTILTPLYQGLGMIFAQIEAMGVNGNPSSPQQNSRISAVWESWKQKLGGKAADAIDALLLHGEMTHTQLKIHIQCGQQTVYDTVHKLNRAGIINKNGGKISLKEL